MTRDLPDRPRDLGGGPVGRNLYGRGRLSGIDVRAPDGEVAFEHRSAKLALEPIPFPDSSFGSVAAYDFLEHVPRIFPGTGGHGTVFPFVRLMPGIRSGRRAFQRLSAASSSARMTGCAPLAFASS